jgi:integrase/recombinase XerD
VVESKLCRGYILQADLGKSGSCHIWRHSAATALLEAGMDLRHLQAFLGHANLSTVSIYTQVGIKALKDLHQAMHPAEALPGRRAPHSDDRRHAPSPEELIEALEAEGAEEAEPEPGFPPE